MSNTKGAGRTRNFATVVYPESAPENWIDIIRDSHINCLISPLHDSDLNPDGSPKKPHYHVLIMFDSVKTLEQCEEFTKSFGGVGKEKINSIRGYARYLCHLDNPEKAPYNPNDVINIGYEDYQELISLPTDKYGAIREMMQYCYSEGITNFSDLLMYASEYNETWFRVLCDNGTYVIKEFLKSMTYAIKQENKSVDVSEKSE